MAAAGFPSWLPERPLVWRAGRSWWWQRPGDQVAVDVCGYAGALGQRDVPPPIQGEEPAAGQLPGEGAGVAVGGRRVEAGPDDQGGSGGPVAERAGVAVVVGRGPGGAGLGQVGPEGAERAVAAVALERSEEHTSELQSPVHLECRLL